MIKSLHNLMIFRHINMSHRHLLSAGPELGNGDTEITSESFHSGHPQSHRNPDIENVPCPQFEKQNGNGVYCNCQYRDRMGKLKMNSYRYLGGRKQSKTFEKRQAFVNE